MSKNISIPAGIVVIGNSLDQDLDLATLNNSNISSFKTLVNGIWKSWSLGTPDAFQGFDKLAKGYGYVVNATDDTEITLQGEVLDMNSITINPGLNVLAMPFDGKQIADGYLPRIRVNTLKTIDGSWKSWSAGSPDAFQGFTTVDDSKGYVCNVEAIFDTFLNNDYRDVNDGVMLGKVPNVLNSVNIPAIEGFDHSFEIKAIEKDNLVTINEALPKKVMYVTVDGKSRRLEFPQELLGARFVVSKLDYNVIDYGKINEAPDGPTTDLGDIGDANSVVTTVYDTLDTKQVLTANEFEFVFTENNDENTPTGMDLFIVDDVLEIMYDKTAFNASGVKKVMNINLDGDMTRLSFAVEYTGQPFVIIKDNVKYPGVFTESEDYIVL